MTVSPTAGMSRRAVGGRRVAAGLLFGVAVVVAGAAWWWSQPGAAMPGRNHQQAGSGVAPTVTASSVLATVDAGAGPPGLRLEVTDVRRPARDVIEVRFALVNRDPTRPLPVRDRFADSAAETGTVSAAYLTDERGATKLYVLRDPEGNPACSTGLDVLAPGERRAAWARFGSPGRGASALVLRLPGLPAVTGLPLPPAS